MRLWEQHAHLPRPIGFAAFSIVRVASDNAGTNFAELNELYKYLFRPHHISPSGFSSALLRQRGVLVKKKAHLELLAQAATIPFTAKEAKLLPLNAFADAADKLLLPKSVGQSLRRFADMKPPPTRTLAIKPAMGSASEAIRRTTPLHAHGNPLLSRVEHER